MPTTTAATATVTSDAESACRLAYTGDFPKLIALLKSYRAHAAGEAAAVTCAVSHPKKWSALHQAVYHAARASNSTSDASTQQQRVEQLVALGVDPTLKNVAGKTAADLAEVRWRCECCMFGCTHNLRNPHQHPPTGRRSSLCCLLAGIDKGRCIKQGQRTFSCVPSLGSACGGRCRCVWQQRQRGPL